MAKTANPEAQQRFIPRDVSWLAFNRRVLQEAMDPNNPLLERAKFLAIFMSNFDEFFMVRVAGMANVIASGLNRKDRHGFYPVAIFNEVRSVGIQMVHQLYDLYQNHIIPSLNKQDVFIHRYEDLNSDQKKFVRHYFESVLFPTMTPMAVDPGHPFPVLTSKILSIAVHIKRKTKLHLAIIPIPKNTPRLVKLPSVKNESKFILVEDIIRPFLDEFFKGYQVIDSCVFRVIRDSEFNVEEELTPDLLKAIESEVKNRRWGQVVYLGTEKEVSAQLLEQLCEGLEFPQDKVVSAGERIDATFLFELYEKVDRPDLCYPGYVPLKIKYDNIFERIAREDFIIHLPFQSFYPTIDLVQNAALDANVLAIKVTLYRTNDDSSIIRALVEAAKNKKQVTVLVEIKARFDEENNIRWVRELEAAGCHVIYGIPGLKIHSKITLIVRREEGMIRRYVHLSTGNYNEKTARVYTDIGYFTANDDVAKDISEVFNVMTGYSEASNWKRIVAAPYNLREYFTALIDREIDYQKKFKNGFIRAKFNSLEDPAMIEKLYEASEAGVKIELMVRGVCCLIPGVKGMSENISVRSVVGRFLEHSRIYMFNSNDNPRIFISSADWMLRNLDRRIELLFEIYKEDIKKHLLEVLDLYWMDNVKARILLSTGEYQYSPQSKKKFDVQEHLINLYRS